MWGVLISTTSCAQPTPPAPQVTTEEVKPVQTVVVDTQEKEIAFSKEDLLGKFEPSKHADFVLIEKKSTEKSNIYLRKEAYEA